MADTDVVTKGPLSALVTAISSKINALLAKSRADGVAVSSVLSVSGFTRISTTSKTFAGICVPPDRRRSRVTIRNVGKNPLYVAVRASLATSYNAPSWSGATSVNPGREWSAEGVLGGVTVGPAADGTEIEYEAYTEARV